MNKERLNNNSWSCLYLLISSGKCARQHAGKKLENERQQDFSERDNDKDEKRNEAKEIGRRPNQLPKQNQHKL